MKQLLTIISVLSSLQLMAQSHWIRIELDVKNMLNPSCNLNEGILDDGKVYAHLGLCSCLENEPFGPENRDCSNDELNQVFCTTQITPFQSRVWQHVVGNWDEQAEDDGVGLMTYEGDSIWSMEFVVEDYFSSLAQTNDSSIQFSQDLSPYTMGLVFRSSDGFYSGRDNGCNDIFITGILDYNPQVIQSTDLSIFPAIKVSMEESSSVMDYQSGFEYEIFPNPIFDRHLNIRFNKRLSSKLNVKTYNTLGQLVNNSTIPYVNSNFYTLKFDNLDSGVYFLSLEANQKTQTNKIIIP
ncbi:MAG: T9SS type A sorting domain-containing protein [Bacteroidota bacterium]|nr:T9SS type A sorting domain-containing protein [Bacteroidota bacterium]